MKKMIEYYYKFKNIELSNIGEIYFFNYYNKKYILFLCRRTDVELKAINLLLNNNKIYNKIIPNTFNQLTTFIKGKKYILVEKINNYTNETIDMKDIIKEYKVIDVKDYNSLLRNNWYDLWTKKIEYIEYQREHIKNKYIIIDQYLDYYIGMAENAIGYYKITIDTFKENNKNVLTLSHRRINSILKSDYYNINDLIIDYPVRNISEYLKYKFFNDKLDNKEIISIFSNINYNELLSRLFYSRMLFPSYFFDVYEKIVNDDLPEREIIPIINKIKKYEEFLKNIFYLINKKTRIPVIDWLS